MNSLIPQALPIVGGAGIGYAMGWLCKKLIKIAIIGIGLILALLAYLEYQKWIIVDWHVVENQTSTLLQHSTQQMLNVVNKTAADLNTHNLNHIDIAYPLLGVTGFLPAFIFGLMKG